MDLDEVDRLAGDVLARSDDPDAAHGRLDALQWRVLDAIAHGRLTGEDAERAAQLAIAPDRHIGRWAPSR